MIDMMWLVDYAYSDRFEDSDYAPADEVAYQLAKDVLNVASSIGLTLKSAAPANSGIVIAGATDDGMLRIELLCRNSGNVTSLYFREDRGTFHIKTKRKGELIELLQEAKAFLNGDFEW